MIWNIPIESNYIDVVGSFTINVTGVLADLSTQAAFTITLVIVSPCANAVFAIDPTSSIFLSPPTTTVSYTIGEALNSDIEWDVNTDLVSSIAGSDSMCGSVIYSLWDYTSGSNVSLDSTIFTQ